MFETFLVVLTVVVLPAIILAIFMPCWTYQENTKRDKFLPEDSYFVNASLCDGTCKLRELSQEAAVDLSIIVPAFNEEKRLPAMMDATMEYMRVYSKNQGHNFKYEILIVDDDSTDGTAAMALQYAAVTQAMVEAKERSLEHDSPRKVDVSVASAKSQPLASDCESSSSNVEKENCVGVDPNRVDSNNLAGRDGKMGTTAQNNGGDPDIRLLRLSRNHGKGGAIRRGVMHSRGDYVLFADADGATDISYLDKLMQTMKRIQRRHIPSPHPSAHAPPNAPLHGVVVGSRAHLESQSIAVRKWYRTVLMRGFHFLVKIVLNAGGGTIIRDTQCGFKLFTRRSARLLFLNLHLEGWVFDIELLYLADLMRVPIAEEAVAWTEVDGSKLIQNKLDIVFTSARMARDMLCMRLAYYTKIWKPIYV